MFNPDQIAALCGGLIEDVGTLEKKTETIRDQMESLRNDPMLSELAKTQNLKPLEEEAAAFVDPLRESIDQRAATLARVEAEWSNPVAVMLQHQPPGPQGIVAGLETNSDRRLRLLERSMERMAFVQQVAVATPDMKQILFDGAVDSGRWDLAGMALLSRTAEDIKAGFRGMTNDEIRAKFPAWGEGRARLAMARAALEEMRLRMAQTESRVGPIRLLQHAHRVEQARRDAGILPAPDPRPDKGEGLNRALDRMGLQK